jgi:hypothetical protein
MVDGLHYAVFSQRLTAYGQRQTVPVSGSPITSSPITSLQFSVGGSQFAVDGLWN